MAMKSLCPALAALVLCVAPAMAQTAARGPAVCLQDMRRLCQGVPPGGGRIIACLQTNRAQLSEPCAATIEGAAADTGAAAATVTRDIAYGSDPMQRLDVYRPSRPNGAIIVMLHGGAWAFGDKAAGPVVTNKVRHWVARGYVFVSVNTRLVPAADPLAQAGDLATAMALVQRRAAEWSGRSDRIVLMAHSSGAHVAALLTADPSIGNKAGLKPWRGTIAIDSAAYDVPALMGAPHAALYDRAFGRDERFWAAVSPLHRLSGTPAPMLLICSTFRRTSCQQANAFARASKGKASVLPVAKSHGELNNAAGLDEAYTAQIDSFLQRIDGH